MRAAETVLTPAGLAELAGQVRGPVLLPGQHGYDAECATFNLIVEHHPAVVVGATGTADVLAAVRFAAANDLPVAVQATGHGVSQPADGALLISTRRMTGLHVDPHTRTARVEAGVRWEQVIHEAAAFGLAPLNGSSPLVGVVGYTLGGGMGPLGRKYGYAADHVRGLDVVTADGRLREVSDLRRPELFWGLLGGKGNFGVVTSLTFDLAPVSRLYGGGLYFPGEAAGEVLRAWLAWTPHVSDEMTTSLALIRLPAVPEVAEPLRGKLMVHLRIAFLGPPECGEQLIRPLRAAAPVVLDTVTEMPYTDVAAIHQDTTVPVAYHERNLLLRELDRQAVDALLAAAGPGSACQDPMVELRQLGGALGRPPERPNAVGNRDAAFCLTTLSPPHSGGVSGELFPKLAEWATGGSYVNFLSGPDSVEDVPNAYDTAAFRRLRALKADYDPGNLFRINHNIRPLSAGNQRTEVG
ncbi:FAD-binding oxidoreductase [Amycolatopsis nigrescens]|uniref:FAD-binding oxidoreductase n=1 Tax=Amycolatopsis nigrescens TaxID=381445 RepID=UPI000687B0BF|nr:FAD-binding oxidoreductase [Amycolatopsis nigrescens]